MIFFYQGTKEPFLFKVELRMIFFQGTKEPFLFKAELRMIFFSGNKGTIPV
jgi:hypothetical protein